MKPKILCLGPEGSFVDQASRSLFKDYTEYCYGKTMEDMVRLKPHFEESGFIMIPLFNSTGIPIEIFLNLITEEVRSWKCKHGKYFIKAASFSPVKLSLLSHPDTYEQADVEVVISHPKALEQISLWRKSVTSKVYLEAASTSHAAQYARDHPGAAAVASKICADIYGLNIVNENIHDNDHSKTLIVAIGRKDTELDLLQSEFTEYLLNAINCGLKLMIITVINMYNDGTSIPYDHRECLFNIINSFKDISTLNSVMTTKEDGKWCFYNENTLHQIQWQDCNKTSKDVCIAFFDVCSYNEKDNLILLIIYKKMEEMLERYSFLNFIGPFPVSEADKPLINIPNSNYVLRLLNISSSL